MNLRSCTAGQLAELMGDLATDAHAETLRAGLLARGIEDTDEMNDLEWLAVMADALRVAPPVSLC